MWLICFLGSLLDWGERPQWWFIPGIATGIFAVWAALAYAIDKADP